jgi:hypothetical protein
MSHTRAVLFYHSLKDEVSIGSGASSKNLKLDHASASVEQASRRLYQHLNSYVTCKLEESQSSLHQHHPRIEDCVPRLSIRQHVANGEMSRALGLKHSFIHPRSSRLALHLDTPLQRLSRMLTLSLA